MPHDFRYIPDANTVFEVTSRTREGIFAFVPTVEVVNEWVGVLSVACERWPQVQQHQVCVLSNHVHMLLSVAGTNAVNHLSAWAGFVFANTERLPMCEAKNRILPPTVRPTVPTIPNSP